MKNVCYLHHNGFFIFEQHLDIIIFKFKMCQIRHISKTSNLIGLVKLVKLIGLQC
jgi:hypothetical protein